MLSAELVIIVLAALFIVLVQAEQLNWRTEGRETFFFRSLTDNGRNRISSRDIIDSLSLPMALRNKADTEY